MKFMTISRIMATLGVGFLAGCGGGGGGDAAPTSGGGGDATTVTLTGVVSVGQPVTGGSVKATALDETTGTKAATPFGTVTLNADGTYLLTITNHTGAVLLEASNLVFNDVATGAPVTGETLRAGIRLSDATPPSGAAISSSSAITPLTEVAVRKVETSDGKVVPAAVAAANALVANTLLGAGSNIISTTPADVTSALSQTKTNAEKEYGLALAALSQVSQGTGSLSTTVGQIAADLKDNDKIDLTGSSITEGMTTFVAGGANQTGVTTGMVTTTTYMAVATSTVPPVTTTNYRYAQLFDLFLSGGSNQIASANGSVAFNSNNSGAMADNAPGWQRSGGTAAALSTTDFSGSANVAWADAGNVRTLTFPDSSTVDFTFANDGRHFITSVANGDGAWMMFGVKTASSGYTNASLNGTFRRPRYVVEFMDSDENNSYTDRYTVIRIDEFVFNGAGTCTLTINWAPRVRALSTTGPTAFSLLASENATPIVYPSCTYSVSGDGKVTIDADSGNPLLIGYAWLSEDGNTFVQSSVSSENIGGNPSILEGRYANISIGVKNPTSFVASTLHGKTYAIDLIGRYAEANEEDVFAGRISITFNADGTETSSGVFCRTTFRTYNGTYGPNTNEDATADCTSPPGDWGYDLNGNNVIEAGEKGTVSTLGVVNFGTPGSLDTWYLNHDGSVMFTVQSTPANPTPPSVDSVFAVGIRTN